MTSFRVPGIPIPQGSMRSVPNRSGKGPASFLVSDNPKLRQWRTAIRKVAHYELGGGDFPIDGPVSVVLRFELPRKRAARNRSLPHMRGADLDKLVRAVLDALTGIAFTDDSRVCDLLTCKRYAVADSWVGVGITVAALEHS
jgi:crossover junction endodeoxyribonuclease RusA